MTKAKHDDLTGVFARRPASQDRGANLAGALPPRDRSRTREAAPAAAPPAPAATASASPERARAPKDAVQRGASPASGASDSADDNAIVNLPVYLPEDLRSWLQAMPRGTTYSDVLLRAFEEVGVDRLVDYFTPTPRTSPSGMPLAPEVANPGSGPQRQFRVRRAQLRWIEGVAQQVKAPSRSTLCAAVLRLYHGDQGDAAGE